jgi:hypothetical protein
LNIHNNCIFPYYGYSIEIIWIYYGFSGAIANFIVWISHFFPVNVALLKPYLNVICKLFGKEVEYIPCFLSFFSSVHVTCKRCGGAYGGKIIRALANSTACAVAAYVMNR